MSAARQGPARRRRRRGAGPRHSVGGALEAQSPSDHGGPNVAQPTPHDDWFAKTAHTSYLSRYDLTAINHRILSQTVDRSQSRLLYFTETGTELDL